MAHLQSAVIENPLSGTYQQVRDLTERLAAPLSPEDQVVQSMPDASPAKWHRAHTTWFFETFLLKPLLEGYEPFDPHFSYLFNSYYEAVGARHPRPQRGLITRPSVAEVAGYRIHVDKAMTELLDRLAGAAIEDGSEEPHRTRELVKLGLNHEQQHQELLLMDIKHLLSANPTKPVYSKEALPPGRPGTRDASGRTEKEWLSHKGGLVEIGHDGIGFCFDNETPRHEVWLGPHAVCANLVTNSQWLEFMADGGYERPDLWLSEGWATTSSSEWKAPLYWEQRPDGWWQFTLQGERRVEPEEPVCHVSYFEADAFARWAGARLPTEAEWEAAAGDDTLRGNFLDLGVLHPRPLGAEGSLFGDTWQWTSSSYAPYPGFRPLPGAVGEYNGKFMVNQYVLRGGCCFSPPGHLRSTYRNFFPAAARWAVSGLRLARDE